jgi:prepilin-type N-terminal cleavage/methylation domain-containing protein
MVHRRRRRRGFTLLEVVIAMSATLIILVALVAWVSSLMRMSTTAIDLASSSRAKTAVTALLTEDLLRARSCDQASLDPLWDHVTANSIGFFADVVDANGVAGSDGAADVVVWRFRAGLLERGVATGDGTCSPDAVPVFSTVASNVSQRDGEVYFTGLTGATVSEFQAVCTSVYTRCRYDRIKLFMVVEQGSAAGSPVEIRETFIVSTGSQRI